MRLFACFIVVALATAGALAALSRASGPPPPSDQAPAGVDTVVAHGSAASRVQRPARRTDATIERAVQRARFAAMPRAVARARREAQALARAAGLELAGPIGVARETAPVGYWDESTGRFGPGRWCGRIFTRRMVNGRRVTRSHRGCPVPRTQSVRVSVTFATR